MYLIRFTIRRKSNQRSFGKYAYLQQQPTGRFMVGRYSDGGSTPITASEATAYADEREATQALIGYLKQIERWNKAMWVKNPTIVEANV